MSSRDLQAVEVRDIHALAPQRPPSPPPPPAPAWETSSSTASVSSENFTTMSREFNALVLAGSTINSNPPPRATSAANNHLLPYPGSPDNSNLERIREEQGVEETNPLAIVPDSDPIYSDTRNNIPQRHGGVGGGNGIMGMSTSVQRVKEEEVEAKISAWQNAKVAKLNNRFKREDAVIGGWENEQVQKATSSFKKIERKLEERRARAMEKMQNEVAKARRKAEEKRATAEASRGTKVARVVELANLMRAVGRPPAKRSFF
ncbi:hypothetical protein MLD38_004441 [Melastoma candidum]|uniref:Uncharacterized protein n=1 Tax=Melastoma candidum TaxID=119954 RepID=A0ACB9S785_9MYRT|nr:hypothetical protein MLD38_004441 [Melastoma candidum]